MTIKPSHKVNRPLSPHLTVYKPQISSVMSILHRATGVFMALSLPLAMCFFVSLARGRESYEAFLSFFDGLFGALLTLALVVSYFYHLANGVRHLCWDAGYGYDIETMSRSGQFVFGVAAAAGVVFWLLLIF